MLDKILDLLTWPALYKLSYAVDEFRLLSITLKGKAPGNDRSNGGFTYVTKRLRDHFPGCYDPLQKRVGLRPGAVQPQRTQLCGYFAANDLATAPPSCGRGERMCQSAMDVNRPKLLARVAVCYISGILLGAAAGRAALADVPHGGLTALMLITALFGISFLVVVLTVAYLWAESLRRRPLVWAANITLSVSLVAGLLFFAIGDTEIAATAAFWAAACALFSSITFFIWGRVSSMSAD